MNPDLGGQRAAHPANEHLGLATPLSVICVFALVKVEESRLVQSLVGAVEVGILKILSASHISYRYSLSYGLQLMTMPGQCY